MGTARWMNVAKPRSHFPVPTNSWNPFCFCACRLFPGNEKPSLCFLCRKLTFQNFLISE